MKFNNHIKMEGLEAYNEVLKFIYEYIRAQMTRMEALVVISKKCNSLKSNADRD